MNWEIMIVSCKFILNEYNNARLTTESLIFFFSKYSQRNVSYINKIFVSERKLLK